MASKKTNVQKGKQGFQKTNTKPNEVKKVKNYPEYAKLPTTKVSRAKQENQIVTVFNKFVSLVKSRKFPNLNRYLRGNEAFSRATKASTK